MTGRLGWIAIGGLGIGVVALSLAYALGNRDLDKLRLGNLLGPSCSESGAKANAGKSERRLTWEGGDTVEIALPAAVAAAITHGGEVIVRGLPDVVAHVVVDHGRITLDCREFGRTRDIEVTLPGRPFRRVGISGSAELVMENVNQPDLQLDMAGSGTARAQGTVDHMTLAIAGSGRARLADLAMKQLTVDISGSGNVEAAPQDAAHIVISGSGNVRLLSRPAQLTSRVSGSGRINQASLDLPGNKK